MKTTIYNDETALYSSNNHFMGSKLLPSSDDSDIIFSGTLL
jgi:hypothetical protein